MAIVVRKSDYQDRLLETGRYRFEHDSCLTIHRAGAQTSSRPLTVSADSGIVECLVLDGNIDWNGSELNRGDYLFAGLTGLSVIPNSNGSQLFIVREDAGDRIASAGRSHDQPFVLCKADIGKAYRQSNEISANDWHYSLLFHGGGAKGRGFQGPFTLFNRAGSGAKYPPIVVTKGRMEYFILDGSFVCNDETLNAGDYVGFKSGAVMNWSAPGGGEMLVVLDGKLDWGRL